MICLTGWAKNDDGDFYAYNLYKWDWYIDQKEIDLANDTLINAKDRQSQNLVVYAQDVVNQ